MTQECPECGGPMPLLSKICPACSYVGSTDTSLSAAEFTYQLEDNLYALRQIPEPTFMQGMMQLTFIIFPLLAIYVLALALISQAGIFFILFFILGICSIWALRKKMKGTLGNDGLNREFKSLKNKVEYNKRMAAHSYGKNREIWTLLQDITGQISEMEQRRKAATTRNVIIWGVILLFFFGLAARGMFSLNEAINEVPVQEDQEEVV